MLKYYDIIYATYHNGVQMGVNVGYTMTDEEVANQTIAVTWENLEEFYWKYGVFFYGNYWNLRRGRRIEFWNNIKHREVEWKNKNIDIQFTIEYRERNPSIETILKYHDGKKAIRYLVERGLEVKK